MPEGMSEYMPDRMPERMSEYMPERMTSRLYVRNYVRIMDQGRDHSNKVILFFAYFSGTFTGRPKKNNNKSEIQSTGQIIYNIIHITIFY